MAERNASSRIWFFTGKALFGGMLVLLFCDRMLHAAPQAGPGPATPSAPRYSDGTGDNLVERLNGAQLDGAYRGPLYYRGQAIPPARSVNLGGSIGAPPPTSRAMGAGNARSTISPSMPAGSGLGRVQPLGDGSAQRHLNAAQVGEATSGSVSSSGTNASSPRAVPSSDAHGRYGGSLYYPSSGASPTLPRPMPH